MKGFKRNNLVLVETNVVKRDGKKTLNFVTVADPLTYENETCFNSNESDIGLVTGTKVNCEIVVKNKFTSMIIKKA